eukprot:642119-Prymnesium_polylepis.1
MCVRRFRAHRPRGPRGHRGHHVTMWRLASGGSLNTKKMGNRGLALRIDIGLWDYGWDPR